ncbi:MAG: hypothetical protein Q8S18_00365 [Bacteroidales bacterium]|nr:hypothetical protein [Bacteroidales bacterium]
MKSNQNKSGSVVSMLFVSAIMLLSIPSFSQTMASSSDVDFRKNAYIGIGTGLNSYTGLLGLRLEVPLTDRFFLFGGAGIGSWGYKIGGGLSYNLKKSLFGPAISLGYSSASGLVDFETKLETTSGTETMVTLDLKEVGNLNLMYSYQWKIGKGNKISLGTGYSFKLTSDFYDVTSNHSLSSSSKQVLEIMAPGGLIVSFAFLFGI